MFNAHSFFMERFSAHLRETNRYLRYIFNGHIAIAMLFLISAIAVYYQQGLTQLPKGFPTALIMAIVFALIITFIPVRTLLKEPDVVFLIPAEHKMNAYFRNALAYSFMMQLFIILFISAAFSPLYFHTFTERGGGIYLLTVVVILVFQAWNLIANWWMLKIRETSIRRIDQVARVLLNGAVFYFIFSGNMIFAGIATILFILLFLYDLSVSRKQVGIAWEELIARDRERMQFFYQIANMFTDVPHVKSKMKKRTWLVSIINKVPFNNKHTYDYLFRITFVRGGDYLGMYVRLIVVGGLLIYFVPNEWMKIIFTFLFLYLSGFQMMALYYHFRTVMWLDLYPVEIKYRRQAVINWLFRLTLLQTIIFAALFVVLGHYVSFIIVLLGGILFNFIFTNGYVKHKIGQAMN